MQTTPRRPFVAAYLAWRALGYSPRTARAQATMRGMPGTRPWQLTKAAVANAASMYSGAPGHMGIRATMPSARAAWQLAYHYARDQFKRVCQGG
jgi:hypothetical protein